MPRLTLAMNRYDRVTPLIDGAVQVDGVDLEYVGFPGGADVFYDQVKFCRYDVSEMSLSTFLRARAGGWGYLALPIFHHRCFRYTDIFVRVGAGIRVGIPRDLEGKRVGVADYFQSAALWTRGILEHEFGVPPRAMSWFQERSREHSLGGVTGFRPPSDVTLHHADADLGTMLQRGELDAAITYIVLSSMDRPKADLSADPGFTLLFADPEAEGKRFYAKHRVFPMHHVTVIRESIVRDHPWIATTLLHAFERAKQVARERLYRHPRLTSLAVFLEQALTRQRAVLGEDPYPYGLRANAEAFRAAQRFACEQGLTEREQPWDELFPSEILVAEGLDGRCFGRGCSVARRVERSGRVT